MENISKQAFDKETSDKELPFSQHASYYHIIKGHRRRLVYWCEKKSSFSSSAVVLVVPVLHYYWLVQPTTTNSIVTLWWAWEWRRTLRYVRYSSQCFFTGVQQHRRSLPRCGYQLESSSVTHSTPSKMFSSYRKQRRGWLRLGLSKIPTKKYETLAQSLSTSWFNMFKMNCS